MQQHTKKWLLNLRKVCIVITLSSLVYRCDDRANGARHPPKTNQHIFAALGGLFGLDGLGLCALRVVALMTPSGHCWSPFCKTIAHKDSRFPYVY